MFIIKSRFCLLLQPHSQLHGMLEPMDAHPWKLRGKKWNCPGGNQKWNCPGGNHLTLLLGSENLQWVLVQKVLFCEELQFLETLESAVLPRPSLHESEPMAASVSSQTFIVSGGTKRHLVQLHVFFNPLLSLCVWFFLKEKKILFLQLLAVKSQNYCTHQKKKKNKKPTYSSWYFVFATGSLTFTFCFSMQQGAQLHW